MHHLKSILILVLLLPCISLASGQQPTDRGEAVWRVLEKYDGDRDGVVTRKEYSRSEGGFSSYDLDGNGLLTREEVSEWVQTRQIRGGRGGQRPQEGRGGRPGGRNSGRGPVRIVLALADADGDGSVDREEWQRGLAEMSASGDSIPIALLLEKLGGGGSRRFAEMLISRLDEDGDGKIPLTQLEEMFQRADGDDDGKVVGGQSLTGGRTRRERPGSARDGEAERGARRGAPVVGDTAPDFDLPISDKLDARIRLSSFASDRPVALVFGSYT